MLSVSVVLSVLVEGAMGCRLLVNVVFCARCEVSRSLLNKSFFWRKRKPLSLRTHALPNFVPSFQMEALYHPWGPKIEDFHVGFGLLPISPYDNSNNKKKSDPKNTGRKEARFKL